MNDSKSENSKPLHDVFLSSREKLSINGVKEILNFDDQTVNLRTTCGELTVEGVKLHVSVLNIEKGEVEMEGKINSIFYYDVSYDDKKTLLSKIFKS